MREPFLRLAVALLATALPSIGSAQSGARSVLYPEAAEPWRVLASGGLSVTILPRPIAEEEIRQIPMIELATRVGIPYDLSLLASLSTNALTTSASAGAQWSFTYDKYSLSIGDRHSFWYGRATIEGFDASALGWTNHPFVSLGVDYREVRILLRAELMYILHRSTRVGDQETAVDGNYNGGSVYTLAIEQPFAGTTDVAIGLRLHVTDSALQSWLAFTTLRDKLVFPELFFTVAL